MELGSPFFALRAIVHLIAFLCLFFPGKARLDLAETGTSMGDKEGYRQLGIARALMPFG